MRGIIIFLTFVIPFFMSGQVHFADGMKWYIEVYGTHTPHPTPHVETEYLEKSGIEGVFKVYRTQENVGEREFITFIKVDGDKILFNLEDSEAGEWYLLYDFGLKPGEGCHVYSVERKSDNGTPKKSYIKCVGISESTKFKGWSIMSLEEHYDYPLSQIVVEGRWIKGLGSFGGLFQNNDFDLAGIVFCVQSVVLEDGTVVFSNPSAGVPEVSDSSAAPDIRVDGLEILVSTDKVVPGSVFSLTGLDLGHYTFGKVSTSITVPESGVYILKIGDKSHKVLVP